MIFIGIDPAFREGGIGCCVLAGDAITFPKIGSFIAFVEYVDSLVPDDVVMVIENSNLQKTTFSKYNTGNARKDKAISRRVGMNQAISQLFVDYARHKLKNVVELSPEQKGKKWTHQDVIAIFPAYTFSQYKGNKTEQDKRDALKLAAMGKRMFR